MERTEPEVALAASGDAAVPLRPRIAVLRNPRSHRNRVATPDPVDPAIPIAAPRDREALAEALTGFAAQGIDVLVIDGGDGTMREVMTIGAPIFGANWPGLLLLPKGKTNALAIDLGLPSKWSLAEALRALPQMRKVTRRPIVAKRQDGEGRQVLGFIMGAGIFTDSIAAGQVAHRFGAFQGLAVAAATLFAVFQALFGTNRSPWRKLTPMRIGAGPDDDVAHSRHGAAGHRYGMGLSTLRTFPVSIKPFGKQPWDGKTMRYLLADAPLRRVVALIPAILLGMDRPFLKGLGVHNGTAEALSFELGGSFILDGEAFPPGHYRLEMGPELPFLAP